MVGVTGCDAGAIGDRWANLSRAHHHLAATSVDFRQVLVGRAGDDMAKKS